MTVGLLECAGHKLEGAHAVYDCIHLAIDEGAHVYEAATLIGQTKGMAQAAVTRAAHAQGTHATVVLRIIAGHALVHVGVIVYDDGILEEFILLHDRC